MQIFWQWAMAAKEWAGVVTAIAAAVTVVGVPFWKQVLKPALRRRADRAGRIEDALIKISALNAAFTKNGGSTIVDSIDRIENLVSIIDIRTQSHSDLFQQLLFEACEDGENVRSNESLVKLFGYAPKELLGHGWKTLIHEDDRDRMVREWDAAISHRYRYLSFGRYVSKQGSVFEVKVTAEPRCDETTGDVLRWMGQVEIIRAVSGAQA